MVTIHDRIPERGDIIRLQASPQTASLQTTEAPPKLCAAMVISPRVYNRISKLLMVCPIVGDQHGWPFEVPLPDSMETYGVVLVDQLRTIDCTARQAKFIEPASPELVMEVISRLETLVT